MANEQVYADGLLNRALDPATQPPEVKAYLQAEFDLLNEVIAGGMAVLDLGCGTGRHLVMFEDRLSLGVGVDYEHSYLAAAPGRIRSQHLHFVTADATAVPLSYGFDLAICMTNTWGTMSDKAGVLREMRRLSPRSRSRLMSVYSPASVPARREWYKRLEQPVLEVGDEYILTQGGFRSEHFSADRLRALTGDCDIRPLADIGYAVFF
ncbi:MAG: class I SAM-dependent methyltransferase [Caldilineaceae bacterium]